MGNAPPKEVFERPPFGVASIFAPIARQMLDRLSARILEGSIELTLPGGMARRLGGSAPGPRAFVYLHDWRALWWLVRRGSSGWYEAWAAGYWTSPDLATLFALWSRNRHSLAKVGRAGGWDWLWRRAGHWLRRNSRSGSRRNIAFHYDLGNAFYQAWLDPSLTYSSGLYTAPGQSLEEAQANKLRAILTRTATKPGDHIVEIGCGWGSFASLAVAEGRHVHGLTLSSAQLTLAQERVPAAQITLTDYRDVDGQYDAVVSIEMAEAVGQQYWPVYLGAIAKALKPGGHAALQIILIDDAIFDAYAANVDFIQTHIFPGGMLISPQRFRSLAERAGLRWQDELRFGADYATTCREWRQRFDAAEREGRLPAQYDAKFRDLWRYYLQYCEGGFTGGGIDVAQVTLVKER